MISLRTEFARALIRMRRATIRSGFALVSALMMMVLLTTIAVGLLSLSAISLSASGRDSDMRDAQTSARLADILTPIAPLLSARSDTFVVRGYGEKLDSAGRVLARAWCEAVVTRGADFVDNSDEATKLPPQLKPVNQTFGRRFDIISFRWLSPTEV